MAAASEEEIAVVEEEVYGMLAEVELVVLLEVCDLISLTVSENVKGKRRLSFKFMMKHLLTLDTSDATVFAQFKSMHDRLLQPPPEEEVKQGVGRAEAIKKEVAAEKLDSGKDSKFVVDGHKGKTIIDVQEKFKITGGSVCGSGDNRLPYSSLVFQIKMGQLRYSEEAICSGVIKAIPANNSLRQYFESKGKLSLEEVKETLKCL